MKAKTRKADIKDIEILNKISIESKMYWKYPQEWIEKWKEDLELSVKDFKDQNIFKVEDEAGFILGFCSIKEHKEEYEILHLWIKPKFIGKGFGKLLLIESIQTVAINNKPIVVEADPHAEEFYSKLGFKTFTKKKSYPPGRFLPVMRKEHSINEKI